MKHLKMCGLAAIAAMAIAAFAGASSASAVTLCKVNTNPCPSGAEYVTGNVAKAKLLAGTEAVLSGSLAVKCTSSEASDELTATSGNPLPDKFTGLTFGGCSGCTSAVTQKLPTSEITATSAGNGTLKVAGAEVLLSGCPLGVKCLAKVASGQLTITGGPGGSEANDPKVTATNVPVTLPGGLCGTSGTWNAKYFVFEAAGAANPPGWVEASP